MAAASRRERRDSAAKLLQAALRRRWQGCKATTKRGLRRQRRAAGADGTHFVSLFGQRMPACDDAAPSRRRAKARLGEPCVSSEKLARRRAEVSALEHELHLARLEVRRTAAAAC